MKPKLCPQSMASQFMAWEKMHVLVEIEDDHSANRHAILACKVCLFRLA